jgi:hypothetical protein
MYELGFAIASGKDVVLICSTEKSERFPFDIQHRGIIQYASDSARDFEKLKSNITRRIEAILKRQMTTQEIASASPIKSTHGLQPNEVAALAFVLANAEGVGSGVSGYVIKTDMDKAGYTRSATQLGLIRLTRLGLVDHYEDSDGYNNSAFVAYRLTTAGEDWLLENQGQLELRLSEKSPSQRPMDFDQGITDDDVPF